MAMMALSKFKKWTNMTEKKKHFSINESHIIDQSKGKELDNLQNVSILF